MRHFIALQSFTSPETRSHYIEGLSYTIRPGNRYLNTLAEVWAIQGKIQFLPQTTKAQLTGTGVVSEAVPTPSWWDQIKAVWRALWQ